MSADRVPTTYHECRAQFLDAAHRAGAVLSAHPIGARGPDGSDLHIDIARLGAPRPARALLVLSGVHGVEGYIGSTLQTDLLERIDPSSLADDIGVVMVHVVNPWGMTHDRRQNEHNVDLNRNWRRDDRSPDRNVAYDQVHPIACPDSPLLPEVDDLLVQVRDLIAAHGAAWVENAITSGQYHHPDGLHFGGDHTEPSCTLLEREVTALLGSADRVFTVDLHTGVGPRSAVTVLSNHADDTAGDTFTRSAFGSIDSDVEQRLVSGSGKPGSIARGMADVLPHATCHSVTIEFGTVGDIEQLTATYQEQWVHRHGDRANPEHRAARDTYRRCFTPDDARWERAALDAGRVYLDAALAAIATWDRSR